MATADQLLNKIYSWIKVNKECEQQLRKLAQELESLREKCNVGKCVGSSVSVLGGLCAVGGAVATVMSAGAAAPLMGLGVIYSGLGGAISVSTEVIEIILSSEPMKKAKEAAKRSNEIEIEIQQLFKDLKMEWKRIKPSAAVDELDQHVVLEIIRAIARRKGVVYAKGFEAGIFMYNNRHNKAFQTICVATFCILAVFAYKVGGNELISLYRSGVALFTTITSTTLCKGATAAVGVVFSLRESIDNWTDLIRKNNMTEASRSLRAKADRINKVTQALEDQLEEIKRRVAEMERRW